MPFTAPESELDAKGFSAPASDLESDDGDYMSTDIPPKPLPNRAPSRATPMPSMAGEMAFAPNDLRQRIEGSPQQTELLRREAGQVGPAAATMAGMTAGTLFPLIRAAPAAPLALRAGAALLNGALGGGAQMGTEEIANQALGDHELSVANVAKQTGKGMAWGTLMAPVAHGLLAGGERVVGAAKEFLAPGLDRAKRVATSLWPSTRKPLNEAQELAEAARDVIKRHTDIEVPIGVAEAVGHPEAARRLATSGKAGAEYTPEEQDSVKRMVAWAAAGLRGANPSPNELGNRAIKLLEDEIGKISAPAKAAMQKTADELHPALTTAFNEIQNDAMRLVPGTVASPTMAGQSMRESIVKPFRSVKENARDEWTALAGDIRNGKAPDPEYAAVDVPWDYPKQWAAVNESLALRGPLGEPVSATMPQGVNSLVDQMNKSGSTQSLDSARRLRTKIYDSIGQDNVFPGTSDYEKYSLAGSITKSINEGIDALPAGSTVKGKLRSAEALTTEKYARFKGKEIEGILKEFSSEGGTGPAAIAAKMTTLEAPSIIAAMDKAAGQNAPELHQHIGEYLFNHVGNAARDPATGAISVGTLLKEITKLAPEVQARYFKGAAAVTKLANREAALAGLTTATKGQASKNVVSALEVTDPALLAEALGPKPSAEVMQKLQLALSENAREAAAYKGTVLGRLKAGNADGITDSARENPAKFVRSIVDETFSPEQARTAIEVIKTHDVDVFKSLQHNFVDHVLSKFQSEGYGIATPKVANELRSIVTAGSTRTQTSEMAETLLGKDKLATLRKMMDALAELDRQGHIMTPSSPVVDVVARTAGGLAGATGAIPRMGTGGAAYQANWFVKEYQHIKHWMGSYLLTTQELRKLALTPIDRIPPETANRMLKGFSTFVLSRVPDSSEEARQAKALARRVER